MQRDSVLEILSDGLINFEGFKGLIGNVLKILTHDHIKILSGKMLNILNDKIRHFEMLATQQGMTDRRSERRSLFHDRE